MKSAVFFSKIIITVGLMLSWFSSSASHFMGVDITYECLGTCIYRVYHSTYFDCSAALTPTPVGSPGTNPPGAPSIGTVGVPNFPGQLCNQPVAVGNWVFVSYTEVTPICPTTSTECTVNNSPIRGVAEVKYYRDYDFCNTNCDVYTLTWASCCRNGAINSLTNPLAAGIYSGSTQINTAITPCNSSPQFANPPVPYLCQGQTYTFNQGAFDPDGDSLVYSLGPCFDVAGVQVAYAPGFTPTQPLGAQWNVSINSLTGDITVTPNPTGPALVAVMCVYVEEWRNGVKIGQVFRDIQMTIIDCSLFGQVNNPPIIDTLINLSPGATANGLTVTTCACDEVCFDIPSSDPDPNQNYLMFWNANVTGTFANALNPTVPVDTVFGPGPGLTPTGQFCWVPTKTGVYTFLVTIQDDGCPLLGQNQFSIVIVVNSCSLDPYASTTVVGCYDVQFDGIPCGGAPPFTYQWTGNGGLFGTGPNLTHSYGGPGNYNYTLTITDSTGTSSSTSGNIVLTNTSVADGGPDITLCPNQVGTIGTPGLPGYTYKWTSPTGLGWSGTPNPTTALANVAFNNTTNNPIVLPFILTATDPNGCIDIDSVLVTFQGKPISSFSATSQVCVGEIATVIYNAPSTPGAIYHWDYNGGTGTSIGPGPHQVSWSTPGTKNLSLWVNINGCISDTTFKTVVVNPIPTATFTATSPVCAGQPSLITYTGSASTIGSTFIWDLDGGAGPGGGSPFGASWVSPGQKTVTLQVSAKGCLSPQFSQTVDVFQVPTSAFNLQASACEGEVIQVVYTGSGTSTGSYAWNFDGGQIVSGSGNGPFLVQWPIAGPKSVCLQVEENGCISNLTCKTINISSEPVASIAPVANQCLSGNSFNFVYNGDVSDSYAWNFGADANPAVGSGQNPGAVSYLNPGVKTVSVVVTRNGCVSDTAKVTFEVIPEPSANFTTSTTEICSDECITFSYSGIPVGANQSYVWNFGSGAIPPSSSLINPPCVDFTTPGVRTVSLAVTYKGCTTTSSTQITVKGRPQISAGADVAFCEGDGGALINASVTGGTAPYFYSWTCSDPPNCGLSSNAVQDPTANPHVAQATDTVVYYLIVNDVNGCVSNIDSVQVTVKAKPRMNAGPDVFLCEEGLGDFLNGSVAATNHAPQPISYHWQPSLGLSDPNVPNPYARPTQTTIYTLVGTSVNGCSSDV
ncbi:MAG: PKD domain-containing protein [Bacteroidia bacterium]